MSLDRTSARERAAGLLEAVADEGCDVVRFEDLHRFLPDLSGPERAAVFYELPVVVQAAAWRLLAGESSAVSW